MKMSSVDHAAKREKWELMRKNYWKYGNLFDFQMS